MYDKDVNGFIQTKNDKLSGVSGDVGIYTLRENIHQI
jgi:hypothetical protein